MIKIEAATETHSAWHIRVRPRAAALDAHGRGVAAEVRQIGLDHIEGILFSKVYLLAGRLAEEDVRLLAEHLLADPVAESFEFGPGLSHRRLDHPAIEVHPLPGVMNPEAISALDACCRVLAAEGCGGSTVDAVQTARRYEVIGARSAGELNEIAHRVLANDCIETWYIQGAGRRDAIPDAFPTPPQRPFRLRHVPLRTLDDQALSKLSREAHLFLSLEEMRAIRDHFGAASRDPTDLELETLAQTWSEHCVHKTLKSAVSYRGDDFGRPGQVEVLFSNLLKETIVRATQTLDRDWCLSVFADNAGVIAFDEEYGIAFKVETHNHPSAIEPYGGAATGVGGCIRDIMGCGLGAKPIASTDVFCFAPPNFDAARLPKDVLHPRRVLKGVVAGVRDYGNRMGIPTVNGAIYFDERYLANPLVFCGCVGLIPRDRIAKGAQTGDRIVLAGGRTGRDGIHGATFSSAELTDAHADEFSHAVQIGNAIEEKKLLDAQLLARDHPDGCLYSSVTDCGAGGLSSAVAEMGRHLGAEVELDNVPLKYAGLSYDEIWISEAHERMVFAVPPAKLDGFLQVFAGEEVEATVIGTFTEDRILRVRYAGHVVGQLEMRFLHEGLPRTTRTARWNAESSKRQNAGTSKPERPVAGGRWHESKRGGVEELDRQQANEQTGNEKLLAALRDLNVASKEWVIRQYDHEVQGRSVVKPLVGPKSGPSDAAVLRPRYDSRRGIAIGCGLCPHLGDVDPYWMAIAAVDEALRNIICVGADPARTAILDNFCWPKVESEESLGALVRACRGAHDAAVAYGLPFISGKDSLNNEFSMSDDEAHRVGLPAQLAIPPTLLISALGIVPDVERCVTMDLKEPGNTLVLVSCPFDPDDAVASLERARACHQEVFDLIVSGRVVAAHDVSDGGPAVAIAEMCIASGLGATVETASMVQKGASPRQAANGPHGGPHGASAAHPMFLVSSELTTAYVLEVSPAAAERSGWPIIGRVEIEPRLRIRRDGAAIADLPVSELAEAWRGPLAEGGVR